MADNRRRLLEAARHLVAEGGFDVVQIEAVARRAGLATGTVYQYFPSKADLLAEAYHLISQHEIDVAAEAAAMAGPAAERLAAAIRTIARRAVKGRTTAYALIAAPADAVVDAQRIVHKRALARVFEGILEDGIAAGEFPRQNVEAAAACIAGAVMESLVAPLAPGSGPLDDDENFLAAVTGFCLRAVAWGGA